MPLDLDLVGETEIAGRAGVKAQTVYVWRRRHADFPAPDVELAMGPVWRWERVAGWLEHTGRAAVTEDR